MANEEFQIVPAVRLNVRPLIGVCGKSGSGKTKSALFLARGLVGPKGRIVGIDTESRRMSDFAGRFDGDPECEIPGGFRVINLEPPFGPDRCTKALQLASQNADVVVWDSASHEWSGEGGCLQLVEEYLDAKCKDDDFKRDKFKASAWAKVGLAHAYLFNVIARYPVPIILCFRTKDKLVIEKKIDEQGRSKSQFRTEEDSPITRKDLIFEMKLSFLVEERENGGGYWKFIKRGTSTLEKMILAVNHERISVAHGEAVAQWCTSAGGGAITGGGKSLSPPSSPQPAPASSSKGDKKTRWKTLCVQAGGGREDYAIEYAVQEGIILDTETLDDWPESKMPKSKAEVEQVLAAIRAKAGLPEEIVP